MSDHSSVRNAGNRAGTRRLPPRWRKAILTAHVAVSVGLLGDSAGFLAVAIRGVTTDDPLLARSSYEILLMFSQVFGIPLSVATLVTGTVLGLGTAWGIFRSPWVATKLLLIVSVMAVGGLVIGPTLSTALETGGSGGALIGAGAYDVVALTLATSLSVFKPGGRSWNRLLRRFSRQGRAAAGEPSSSAEPALHDAVV